MRLENKVIFITGGASGIGAETTRVFVQHGAKVCIADIDVDAARHEAAKLGADEATAVEVDVTVSSQVAQAIDHCVKTFGRLDGICNSAGIVIEGDVTDISEQDWHKVMDVNVNGTFLCCRHGIPKLIDNGGGSIINIGSIQSFCGDSVSSAYTTSKAAILTLTRNIAVKYAQHNVRANTICPGDCETPLMEKLFAENPGLREKLSAKYPIGRLAQPRDIANGAVFLASDESSFITGSELTIDGGFRAR